MLDEPAAGMNPLETQELMEFIKMLNEGGYTIAVIEHDMKFVMNSCNRILVLNFGQKICEGTPDEVKANKEVQEADQCDDLTLLHVEADVCKRCDISVID